MIVEETYQHIIEKLREDKRPLLRLNKKKSRSFNYWMVVLKNLKVQKAKLTEGLCILDHSQGYRTLYFHFSLCFLKL